LPGCVEAAEAQWAYLIILEIAFCLLNEKIVETQGQKENMPLDLICCCESSENPQENMMNCPFKPPFLGHRRR
jgi:hypothetical protein